MVPVVVTPATAANLLSQSGGMHILTAIPHSANTSTTTSPLTLVPVELTAASSTIPLTITPRQLLTNSQLLETSSVTTPSPASPPMLSTVSSPVTPSSSSSMTIDLGSDDEDMEGGKYISRKSDGTRRKPPKRITTEKLVAYGLIVAGDKIQFRTPKKTIESMITNDGQIIWTNPKTNKAEQFNYLSRWNNRVDLVVEPSVNRPQHNGWDKTFLVLDAAQRHRYNGLSEVNFREIRDRALRIAAEEAKRSAAATPKKTPKRATATTTTTTAATTTVTTQTTTVTPPRETRKRKPTPKASSSRVIPVDDEETEPSSDEGEPPLEDEVIIPPPVAPPVVTPVVVVEEGRQKRKRKPSELVADNAEFERYRKQARS